MKLFRFLLIFWLICQASVSYGMIISDIEAKELFLNTIKGYEKPTIMAVSPYYVLYDIEIIKKVIGQKSFREFLTTSIFTESGYFDCDDYSEHKMSFIRRFLPLCFVIQVYDYSCAFLGYRSHAYCIIFDKNKEAWIWDSTTDYFTKLEKPFYHSILFALFF